MSFSSPVKLYFSNGPPIFSQENRNIPTRGHNYSRSYGSYMAAIVHKGLKRGKKNKETFEPANIGSLCIQGHNKSHKELCFNIGD
jgi:hypothetical protein